jgi:hypothetical protein
VNHVSVREQINSNPKVGVGLAALLAVVAGAMIYHFHEPALPGFPTGAFYSDDDGKTWFKDSIYRFAPFDHDSKTAVMALVFSDGQGQFVALLERYTAQTKKQLEDMYERTQDGTQPVETLKRLMFSRVTRANGIEYKVPGDGNKWQLMGTNPNVRIASRDGSQIQAVTP